MSEDDEPLAAAGLVAILLGLGLASVDLLGKAGSGNGVVLDESSELLLLLSSLSSLAAEVEAGGALGKLPPLGDLNIGDVLIEHSADNAF